MPNDPEYKTKEQAEILQRLRENPRVSQVRISAPKDCNVGQNAQGVYEKELTPVLPVKGCSRPGGCICNYEPVLNDIFP